MAITQADVVGPVLLPSGEIPAQGRILFTMNGWDVEADSTLIPGPVYVDLDESGNFSVSLWCTSEGGRTVSYRAALEYWSVPRNRKVTVDLSSFVVSPGGPYELADLLAQPPVEMIGPDVLAVAQAAAISAAEDADRAEAAADRIDLGAFDADVAATATARDEAEASAVAADASADAAAISAAAASAAEAAAELANDAAQLSRGIFASTTAGLSKGVVNTASLVGGSGGTNGTFALAFSGGGGSNAAGDFVVAGGAVTQINITNPGTGYTSAPTISFAASSGLTGASATAVIDYRNPVGTYFSVPATGNDALILYRVDSGPVATEVARYPSAASVTELRDSLPAIAPEGYAWSVVDQDGKAAIGLDADGRFIAGAAAIDEMDALSVSVGDVTTEESVHRDYGWSITDQDGKLAIGVDNDGLLRAYAMTLTSLNGVPVAGIIAGSSAQAGVGAGYFAADIVHLPLYGQSLSTGVSVPSLLTTSQRFDSLMFAGGVRAQDDAAAPLNKYSSLEPLIEAAITPAEAEAVGTYARETPGGGAADYIKELINSENGLAYTDHDYQVLISAPGRGATTISNLSKPGTLYSRIIADVQAGFDLAQAAGRTFKAPAVFWLQGESDAATAVATYSAALQQLRADLDADIKAITDQPDDVLLICYQTASTGNAALGQMAAAAADDKIIIAGPHYHLAKSDGVHFATQSSKVFGGYLGRAYKRACIDQTGWAPLMPVDHFVQGAVITLRMSVPKGVLQLDTVTVPAQTNGGFTLVNSGGSSLTISSVEISGPDTVRIVASSPVPAGAKLRYARAAALGNLRDTAGEIEIFDGGGINYKMHNWCVAFERAL